MRFQDTSLDPVSPLLRAAAVAVHDRGRRAARCASSASSPTSIAWSVEHHASSSSTSSCSTTRSTNDGPIELSLNRHVLEIGRLRVAGDGTKLADGRAGRAARRRRSPSRRPARPTSASCRASSATCAAAAPRRCSARSRGRSPSRSSPAARASSTAASATCPRRTGSKRINGTISFDGGGIRIEDIDARVAGGAGHASAAASR